MNPRSLVLVALVALGCGSGRARPDVSSGRDAASDATDASVADAPVSDAGTDGDADAFDGPPKPLPVAAAASRVLVAGGATLVGHGLDSCTNAAGASGDRWCAFARPVDTGYFELWLVDATKAAAAVTIACDGTDASCVRLSTRVYLSAANGFGDVGFNGDTLIYGEASYPGSSTEPFRGVLTAWRPGWAAGRALTAANGVYCLGHASADAALCFEDPSGDGMIKDLTIDLHAGRLSAASGPTLPKIDTLLLASVSDAVGASPRYESGLSPDGAYVAWSTRATATGVETLSAQKIDDATARTVVAANVSQWAMSPDGLAWYWLAGFNYDVTGAPAGTLTTAAFPDGSGAAPLATAVGDFTAVGDKGLRFRANVASQIGTLRWMADRGAPATVVTVDTNVLTVLDQARDGAQVVYAKTFAPVRPASGTAPTGLELVDLYVGSVAGDAPCVLAATPTALEAALTPSGSVAVWDRYDTTTGFGQGVATTVASCTSTPFAERLRSALPAGDDAYVYLDDADATADEATLRYAHVMDGSLVVGTTVQTRAASVFAPVPALSAVLYTVATNTAADGLYVYVDAPPSAPDASAPDAVTPEAGAPDAVTPEVSAPSGDGSASP